jgi:ribose-phosphate pyrophosphokinase
MYKNLMSFFFRLAAPVQKLHPIIVSGYSSQNLAKNIADVMQTRLIDVSYKQFQDREIQTTINDNVRGREVVVVASASGDPNKQEKETRLLMRAAKQSGAKSVTLLLPYMWYGRSDDNWDERNAPALVDTIENLRPHCDHVLIVDPHNQGFTREKFACSTIKNRQTIHLAYPFAVQLKSLFNEQALNIDDLLLSHADAGSTKRISPSFRKAIYNVLGLDRNPSQDDWAQGQKDRDKVTGKSCVRGFSQDVQNKHIVIFEDMLSTGGTACDLADFLKKQGAKSVILFATNGLFNTTDSDITKGVQRINNSQLDAVFIADTYDHSLTDPAIHQAIENSPIIHVIKTAPYLASIINAMLTEVTPEMEHDENSISALLSGCHPHQIKINQRIATATALKSTSPLLKIMPSYKR